MSSLEELFSKLAMTTVTTVSRIALNHATNAAIRNVTAYIQDQPKSNPKEDREQESLKRELEALKRQLDLKVKNLKPTIDIIARSVADDNKDLEPALEMCTDLTSEINQFSLELKEKDMSENQVKAQLKQLLAHIDDVVPSLHLALRSLEASSNKPRVSRSKLVQSSSILQMAKQAATLPAAQPSFCLRLYSLFSASGRRGKESNIVWKEEFHKCHLTLQKIGASYSLLITEDLDDGLYHEEIEEGKSTGKSLRLNVELVKRMYYTRSGQLLNIEKTLTPVLVLKLLKTRQQEKQSTPVHATEANPQIEHNELAEASWYAVEIYPQDGASDSDDEEDDNEARHRDKDDDDHKENLNRTNETDSHSTRSNSIASQSQKKPESPATSMTLLLLEAVIKLCLLETTEQMDHLSASDELIDLYMA